MKYAISLCLLLAAAPLSAQPRPGAFTTLTTTSTITDGGNLVVTGATTLTGAATTTANLTVGGMLSVTGFGSSGVFTAGGTGINEIAVRNTAAGVGNSADIAIGNDADARLTILQSLSSTFTSTGGFEANGSVVYAGGVGGLSLYANAAAPIRFYTTGAEQMRIWPAGAVSIGNLIDIGTPGNLNVQNQIRLAYDAVNAYGLLTSTELSMFAAPGLPLLHVDTTGGLFMQGWSTTASAANAHVGNGDYLRIVTSLRAAKHDIEPITTADAMHTVMGLRAVLYQSRVDTDQRQWAGFIADEVERVNPVLAVYQPDGALQSVTYDRVPAYLVPVVQDQERRIEALELALKVSSR